MRAGIIILVNLILFLGVVDTLLYLNLRKFFPSNSLPSLLKIVFWTIPVAFTIAFIWLFVKNSGNITEQDYYLFTMLNGIFLLLYIPKLTYLIYAFFYAIVIRLISAKSWAKPSRSVKSDKKSNRITRAAFLGRAGMAVAGAPFLSLLYGMAKGRFNFFLKPVTLHFQNLPDAFDGLKIVQISDIHLGNLNKEYHRLHEVSKLINAENPDLIFMTGDLVNNFATETEGWENVFSKMNARIGKYSILGNHDYGDYSRWTSVHAKRRNFEDILAAHKRFGFHLLRNENTVLEKGKDKINLIGVENWGKPPFPQYGNLALATHGMDANLFQILLSHDPDHWEAEVLPNSNVDFTLSGHTHGMQFGVKFKNSTWSPAKWKYKYWDGLYKHEKRCLYVNRGLGFIGIPMRVGMPPEITVFTLKRG